MLRTVTACVVSVAITLGVVAAATTSASTTPAPFSPACPSPGYGADGDMGPLFCVIDNPVALRYFAALGRHLFALGPNATPGQVLAALERDLSTLPITCSVYRLAAWRNHWHFGISPLVQLAYLKHLYSTGWCKDPAFNVGS